MTDIQFFYRKDTQQIDAVYENVKTRSAVFTNTDVYQEVNIVDPPFDVTRDHKVILDEDGNVIGTDVSLNPVQPAVEPNPNQDLINELTGNGWTTGTPEKLELLKKVLLRLLD